MTRNPLRSLRLCGKDLPILTLLLCALIAALPVWGPGLVNTRGGGDSPFLLWRVHQLAANLRDGVFPARWMPDAAYSLGYPFFNYYAALPYYIASLLYLGGLDILTAIKLTQTLGFILAALTSYGWFRRVFTAQAAAWLGAVAYTFAPFHLVNVYVRGDSLSEFYAFAFYPLILWAADNAAARRTAACAIALGLAYGGLVITHTLSAAIFSPFVLLYALIRTLDIGCRISDLLQTASFDLSSRQAGYVSLRSGRLSKNQKSKMAVLATGLLAGLALSAWYWLPALLEMPYVQTSTLMQGYFHYSGHFRATDLVQPTLGFVYDTTLKGISPFAMGLAQAVAAGLGFIACCVLRINKRNTEYAIRNKPFIIAGLLISTLMLTPLSRPLWDHLPILPMTQFPWRFLSAQALFAAMAAALTIEAITRRRGALAASIATALALAMLLPLHPDRLLIDASDVTTERLQLYELFTANIGTTITYEWLPRDVNPRPYTSELLTAPPQAVALEGQLTAARETLRRSTQRVWHIEAATDVTLMFPVHYWPGWQATLDGAPAPVRPARSSGRIVLDVPQGQHTITLELGRTPLRLAAELASLATLLVCGAYCVLRVAYCISSQSVTHYVLRFTLIASALLILVIIANQSPPPAPSGKTMDFVQMPYLHEGDTRFGANTLIDYQIDSTHIAAGQSIHLTLNWKTIEPLTATLALVDLGEHLPDLHAPCAISQSSLPLSIGTQTTQHTLVIPSDLAAGIYLIQVRVVGPSGELFAHTANGAQMGPLYLEPVYVQNEQATSDESDLAAFGDRIHLHAVNAEQTTPTQLLVKLDWSVSKAVAENYGIALRLYDAQDNRRAAIDTQPGHGFLPTTTWRPGQKITDRLILSLPEGLPPRDDYTLEIILYDLANNLAGIGQYFQPGVALTHYARRNANSPVLAKVEPQLALATLDLPSSHPQGAPTLRFEAGWLATAPAPNVIAQWTLIDQSNTPVATRAATLDAARWPVGAYMLDSVAMPIPAQVSAGEYRMAIALFDAQTNHLMGQVNLEQTIKIAGRRPNFTLPPLDHDLRINLQNQIRLEGYTLKRDQDAVHLTLAWRALQPMPQDYTLFVHLLNAANGIAAQYDAMPLANTYPTSWWASSEVVSETITLPTQAVAPGAYRLAIGMYTQATATRLQAFTSDGQRLPDDRILLPDRITLP